MRPLIRDIYAWLESVAGPDKLWILEVFLVVFITLLNAAVVGRFVDKLAMRVRSTKNLWDDSFFESLSKHVIEGHGAECAFPTSTMHIPKDIAIADARAEES